jgi:SnoaL-like protein
MPSAETLERFIARVESGAHAEAIAEFYAENGAIRENQAAPRVGRSRLVEHERSVLRRAASVESICVRPALVDGPTVVIRWIFRFRWLDGTSTEMEELAYQRWQGEQIAEEQFFYDPSQLRPKGAGV